MKKIYIDEKIIKVGKYRNIKQEYNGFVYASRLEANYAWELDQRVKNGEIKSWVRQLPFQIILNDIPVCKYITDFVVTHNNGDKEIKECKGYFTNLARLKMKLLKAMYGRDYKITLVKYI